MKKVKLGEVCDVFSGYAFKSFNEVRKGKPVIKIGNVLSNGKIEIEDCSYTEEIPQNKYLSQKNDIYVALSGATTGKVGLMQKEGFLINQRVGVVRLKNNEVPINYIYSFLQSKTSKILEDAFGAAQPNISPKDILNYEIFIGENAEMQAIADRLDKVSSLIEKRKTQLSKLDELIKSRFVELFGDIILNPNDFEESTVSEYCKMIQGTQIPMSEQITDYQKGYYRYLYIRDLKYNDNDWIYVKDKYDDKKLTSKDLVVVNTGNTAGEIYYGKEGILSNNLFKISFDNNVLSTTYMFVYFSSQQFQNMLWSEMKEGTQPHLGHKIFGSKKLLVPPIELQNQFAVFVEQVDKTKLVIQKSINKLETLKKSLMQQYFG